MRQSIPSTGDISSHALHTAEAAGLSEAVTWLDMLPAYRGAQMLSARPYLRAVTTGAGVAAAVDKAWLARAMGVPASPYLIDIFREWRVPGSESRVLNWVKAEAAARGLVQSGGVTPVGSGDQITGVSFTRTRAAEVPAVLVDMRALSAGQTLVRYDAIVIWQPPRPVGEFLAARPESMTLQAWTGTGFGPDPVHVVATKVTDNGQEMARFVALVNALPRDTRGPHGCPGPTGTRYFKMLFHYHGGAEVAITEGVCDGVVFGAPGANPLLADPTLTLWSLAATLVGESSWLPSGTPTAPSDPLVLRPAAPARR